MPRTESVTPRASCSTTIPPRIALTGSATVSRSALPSTRGTVSVRISVMEPGCHGWMKSAARGTVTVTPMTLIRPDLDSLPAYVPGKTIPGAIKLASNEVALPPTPPVLAAIAEAAAIGNRYPDLAVTGLTARLAEARGVAAERIAVGCGSVSLCQQLVQATCR